VEGERNTYREQRILYRVLAGNLKEGGYLKNLGVNGKNFEVCYTNKMEVDGIFWTRIGKNCGHL
jgi:hypothetical protein